MTEARYLLDTNIVSIAVREPGGTLARRLASMHRDEFAVSIIVACELRYGVVRKGSPRLAKQLEAVLEGIDILPMEEPADAHYGDIRTELERIGRPISHNDLLIAAHARALGGDAGHPQRRRVCPRPEPHHRELGGRILRR